jgi:ribosome biogenesis GTPase
LQGTILKGIGSFYTVLCDDGTAYTCKARGKFRVDKVTPLPGDRVEFEASSEQEGYMLAVLPRKNSFTRPAVANVDQLVIVMAASAPKPDLLLTDRLLLDCERRGVMPLLVLNKCDERDEALIKDIIDQYAPAGYRLIVASAHEGDGLDTLKDALFNKVSCFTGQSAVGKTSLLNALLPELDLPVGDLSKKIERGKNTTRHAELVPAYGGAVADTPGFSLLEMSELKPEELSHFYPEMKKHLGECYFTACMHITEPDCAVKSLLGTNELSRGRYERYCELTKELIEMRKHRYD